MYSISYLRRQADALRRRLQPVLQILRLRNLAMEFCDELDEAALNEDPRQRDLTGMCIMFMPRIGQAGFRLETSMDLDSYLRGCLNAGASPDPREMVFTLLPWARKGPLLRSDLWERPNAA